MYQIHVRLALFNLQKGLQKHQLVPPTRIWPSIYSFKKSPTKELYKRAPQKPRWRGLFYKRALQKQQSVPHTCILPSIHVFQKSSTKELMTVLNSCALDRQLVALLRKITCNLRHVSNTTKELMTVLNSCALHRIHVGGQECCFPGALL